MRGAKFINNPYDMVIKVFDTLFPDTLCAVQFDGTMENCPPWGATVFPDEIDAIPMVYINANLTIVAGVGILAHELAHVVCGVEEGHGEKWKEAADKIHEGFNKLAGGE